MGCFNQSCNLTHVDINDNDVCMILPILRNSNENGGYENLNDGPFRFFKPFCLPIIGKYDHYGRINHIKKDRNTELLEKYFEMPIEEFIECIAGGGNSMYRDDSTIQKMYGKGVINLTIESLDKIHFKTGEDKAINHPLIDKVNTQLMEKYTKEGKPFVPVKIYWKSDTELTIEEQGYEGEVYKHEFKNEGHYDVQRFLEQIHITYKSQCSKLHPAWGVDEFIFGIPSVKQERAHTLMKLTRSFIRPEAYKKISKTFQGIHAKYLKTFPQSIKWDKQRFDEYVEAVKAWKHAITVREKYKDKLDKDLTPVEVLERHAYWMASFGRENLFRGGPISDGFKSTYTGEEFLAIYGDVMLDDEFIKRFNEFKFVEHGMVAANVMLYDNHSLEQHGDIDEQMTYLKICVDVATKVRKQRNEDYCA